MLKKIKLNNSTILLIGIIIIVIGIIIGCLDYFIEKKNLAFSEMNVLLFENEIPENIESQEQIENEINVDDADENEEPIIENEVPIETKYDYIGILEIPKINLKRGFLDINSRYNNVDYNITIIQGSSFPDKDNNNLILAAHSGICSVCFFNDLYKLGLNDVAYLYYNNIKYQYKIVNIYEVEKDGTVAIYRNYNKSTLTLITCTRNSDTKQTVYILELVDKQTY